MSHSHRDDLELVDPGQDVAEPVVEKPPAPLVANAEAERRAEERRKLEGTREQITQHQFTGDIPDPERGGTDTETRFVPGEGGDHESDDSRGTRASAARRGPPAPRFQKPDVAASWAAPPTNVAASLGPQTSHWTTESESADHQFVRNDRSWTP